MVLKNVIKWIAVYMAIGVLGVGSLYAQNFKTVQVGSPIKDGTAVAVGSDGFDLTSYSSTMWGTYDETTFVYIMMTNEFDVRVRVEQNEGSQWARAGIMAREQLNAGAAPGSEDFSPYVEVHATPYSPVIWQGGAFVPRSDPFRGFECNRRLGWGQATSSTSGGTVVPTNSWVRLVRMDGQFTAYFGYNGIDWTPIVSIPEWEGCPEVLHVGVHYALEYGNLGGAPVELIAAYPWTAKFRNLTIITPQPPKIIESPKDIEVLANQKLVLKVKADYFDPFEYQWKKDGSPIEGATNAEFTIPIVTSSDAGNYSVVVKNKFGETETTPAMVKVIVDNISPQLLKVLGIGNKVYLTFDEPVQSGGTFSIAGATVVSSVVDDSKYGMIVTLGSALVAGQSYTINVSGVKDLAGNVIDPVSKEFVGLAVLNGKAVREYYAGYTGGSIADLMQYVKNNSPTLVELISALETPSGIGDYYGQRLLGFLIPPETGTYTFYLASDDQSQVWLSTDETPANASLIVEETSWAGSRNYQRKSRPISLVAGKPYFFTVYHREGTGGDNLAVAWIKPSDGDKTPADLGGEPIPGDYLALVYNPNNSTVNITEQSPATVEVLEKRSVTLSVKATGSSDMGMALTYQWKRNGVIIEGATTPTLTIDQAELGDNNAVYTCDVSVFGKTVTSAPMKLVVTPDKVPPTVVSAGFMPGGNFIGIMFDEKLDQASATTASNYKVNGTPAEEAYMTPINSFSFPGYFFGGGKAVVIKASGIQGTNITIQISGVMDLAYNEIVTTNITVQIFGSGLTSKDIGSEFDPAYPGQVYPYSSTDFDVEAAGSDIWNNADGFHFLYQERTGDFDMVVQVAGLLPMSRWSKAGFDVRETLEPGSRNRSFIVAPEGGPTKDPVNGTGVDQYESNFRADPDGSSSTLTTSGDAPYPNAWIRLKRSGSTFTSYRSVDGVNWTEWATVTDTAYPAKIYVGIATCSHYNGETTVAEYRNLNLNYVPPVVTPPKLVIRKISNNQVEVDLPATGWILEWTSSLTSAEWTAVQSSGTVHGDILTVTVDINGIKFFRARRQ